jgi:hypothetical protein
MNTKILVMLSMVGLVGCTTTHVEKLNPTAIPTTSVDQITEPIYTTSNSTENNGGNSYGSGDSNGGNSYGNGNGERNIFRPNNGDNANSDGSEYLANNLYLKMHDLKSWYQLDNFYMPLANQDIIWNTFTESREFCNIKDVETLKSFTSRSLAKTIDYKVLYAAALETQCPEQKKLVNITFPNGNPKTTFLK